MKLRKKLKFNLDRHMRYYDQALKWRSEYIWQETGLPYEMDVRNFLRHDKYYQWENAPFEADRLWVDEPEYDDIKDIELFGKKAPEIVWG